MLECCAFDGGFVLGAGRVAGRGYLLDGREPLIFLPNNILARSSLPIPDRTAACEEGARILGGKNMKTLRCRCETVFLDGVGLLSSARRILNSSVWLFW